MRIELHRGTSRPGAPRICRTLRVAVGGSSPYDGPMRVTEIDPLEVTDTHNLLQSPFWAAFKEEVGNRALAFRFESKPADGEVIAVQRAAGSAAEHLYVPHGPEVELPEQLQGTFLLELSQGIADTLATQPTFLRYDLRWLSPFTGKEYTDENGNWLGRPEPRVQEMRMNFGTGSRAIRKAPTDIQPPDTVIIDVRQTDQVLFERMRPKTRYNIRLALRNGLQITEDDAETLDEWHSLYQRTCERQQIICEELSYFQNLFAVAGRHRHVPHANTPSIRLINARYNGFLVAGLIYAMFRQHAYYLYGASAREHGNLMAPYGVQWRAMLAARGDGCHTYDMFGVPPTSNPAHPMHGLYRFKTGFGGEIRHFRGCWDYPVDIGKYNASAHLAAGFGAYHLR
jgi:lipid II:glycine glycyltransferase (peptidoglycan interpeptide bridge formation enzyme)